ncbi:MAG: zinc-binding dehydrogenase [Gammaproteobacteria bacterium]|nr:zinc-binding dehydrogenase [Gammaproteobacteria bacterium]
MELPSRMNAVVTLGNGGYEQLRYQTVPLPKPGDNEVLLRVLAAGVNNTEINTRLGWYSDSITAATEATGDADSAKATTHDDGGWDGATPFPLIQGTDCCGRVLQVPPGHEHLLGKRVLVRACMRTSGFSSWASSWMGSNFDGAFAEYVIVPMSEVFAVNCDWSDAELASIPCAYATAENMLHRAGLQSAETVLVSGASGGVGLASVQLAKRRGAKVIAIAGADKHADVMAAGADQVYARNVNLEALLGPQSVDLVVDNVAGEDFSKRVKLLKVGGRLATSGAIAGPIVNVDLRDLYLKDIRLLGSTAWDEPVFPNLVSYIEAGQLTPKVSATYALADIVQAQQEFAKKEHVGKIVLIP